MANQYDTSYVTRDQMGQVVDEMLRTAKDARRSNERHWYDNNFFDDGYHFRYLSRTQNKIIDLSERQTIYNPIRAIPKASRQIRGVANLLLSSDPTPVVYPEKVNLAAYPGQPTFDPQTQQQVMQPNPELQEAQKEAKRVAKLTGHWITEEFKNQDIMEKLALMAILAMKHSVSYMQIWPDSIDEAIRTQVYDAFDIYLMGDITSIYDSPYIIKAVPRLISQMMADENFDEKQREKLKPDNKFASSEIKEAYMRAKNSGQTNNDQAATILQKEAFIKEYLNKDNYNRITQQDDAGEVLKGKKMGDMVMRQIFAGGDVWLRDKYVKLPDYPFVDFRLEPGPIYSVPLIERFIPSNKSLDLIVSRLERFTHTMVTGAWLTAEAEGNLNITNQAGGQQIRYKAIPPTQAKVQDPGQGIFNLSNLLNSFIEEQGLTTSLTAKLPAGVKGHQAIESLKESEYANLVISSRRLKGTIKRIAEKFLDIADDHFVSPQTVYYMEKGEPQYFDVVGESALKKRQELQIDDEPLDAVPLKREYRVEIEIQSGAAYTREGKKAAAQQMIADLTPFVESGLLPPDAFKVILEKYMDMYQFGGTDELMEALESPQTLTDSQLDMMKIAIAEVLKDLQGSGILPDSDQRIDETKVGAAEAIRDSGGIKQPPDEGEQAKTEQQLRQGEAKHQLQTQSQQQKMAIERAKAMQEMKMKEEMNKATVTNLKKQGNVSKDKKGKKA